MFGGAFRFGQTMGFPPPTPCMVKCQSADYGRCDRFKKFLYFRLASPYNSDSLDFEEVEECSQNVIDLLEKLAKVDFDKVNKGELLMLAREYRFLVK